MESDVSWKWAYLLSSQKTDGINTKLSSVCSAFQLKDASVGLFVDDLVIH